MFLTLSAFWESPQLLTGGGALTPRPPLPFSKRKGEGEKEGIHFIRVTDKEINTDIYVLYHRIEAAIMDSSSRR